MLTDYGNFFIRLIDLKTYNGEQKRTSRNIYEESIHSGKFVYQFTSDVSTSKIENFVKSKIGCLPRVFARKCIVRGIDANTFYEFGEKHHIQGGAASHVRFGLFYENELVGAIGFCKYEDAYNLNRMIFGDYNVVGGAEKLLSAFRETYRGKIITYSNNGYSNGAVYNRLGFSKISETHFDMWYVSPSSELINRRSLQKKKLKDKVDIFDGSKTEIEILKENGYNVWFGPGTIRWELPEIKVVKSIQQNKSKRGISSDRSKQIQMDRVNNGKHHFQSDEYKRMMSDRLKLAASEGRSNQTQISTCPHCGYSGKGAVMSRWHFNKCKKK